MKSFAFENFALPGLNFRQFEELLTALGSPQLRFPCILVGGTNGKGSVATLSASLCHQYGKRVGLFLSPHVQHFNERFSIDGKRIAEAEFQALADKLAGQCNVFKLNYFQFLTLLAWFYFLDNAVDLAVMEVGIGGRLDPTNASEPAVSAVTSIDLDHMDRLGNSIEAIFLEKMAISRRGRPLIFGACQVTLKEMALCWGEQNQLPIFFPQPAHRSPNLATAVCLVQQFFNKPLARSAIQRASTRVQLPGRQQQVGNFLIDMAHNDSAIQHLVRNKQAFTHIIVAQPQQHPWTTAFNELSAAGQHIICPRSIGEERQNDNYFVPANQLLQNFAAKSRPVSVTATLQEALNSCNGEPTLIVGSARLAGSALDLLCIDTNHTPLYS